MARRSGGKMPVLTEDLCKRSNGILQIREEVGNIAFRMFDDGGVECEVGEFLYGLIRCLKPTSILETGTYTGVSAMYMGEAVKDNSFGKVITLEFEPTHKERAEKLWQEVGVNGFVHCILMDARDYKP